MILRVIQNYIQEEVKGKGKIIQGGEMNYSRGGRERIWEGWGGRIVEDRKGSRIQQSLVWQYIKMWMCNRRDSAICIWGKNGSSKPT